MLIVITTCLALMTGYVGGRLHRQKRQRVRIPNGSALQHYASPLGALNWNAIRERNLR